MLVLGRRPGEYVLIGDNIKVQVVKSKEGDLRLSIEAPKEIPVIRGELLDIKTSSSCNLSK
ncbi:carbon storage regulator, CsrA [Anaerovirgula multivorans]|uniref:Translational regulator CsrA n=1 Tax=Anaerovirgula multivorans TaxID=312168 RepID=A0A239CFE2_9FIRM|nr:carbon storage regulator [Anaerovirgula multivorans]SNS18388.1 carbon storage regulator, CsrA [Anaerovirgula multivorans]